MKCREHKSLLSIKVDQNSFILVILNLMSGSCHLDRTLNVKIGGECQIFVIVIFFNCGCVLQFGAHSRYYKGALTQKRLFFVICTKVEINLEQR